MLYLISLPISRYHILKRKNVIAIIIIALHIFFFAPGSCGKWFQIFFPQSNFSKQARLMKNMNHMKPVIWITSYDSQRTALKTQVYWTKSEPSKIMLKIQYIKNCKSNVTTMLFPLALWIVSFNGKSVFNRLLDNGWSNLNDFKGRPHEFYSGQMLKKQPTSTSVGTCAEKNALSI